MSIFSGEVHTDLPRGKGRVAEGSVQGTNLEENGGKIAGIEAGEGAVLAGIVVARLGATAAPHPRPLSRLTGTIWRGGKDIGKRRGEG